jgi:hypothetical protein
VIGDISGAPDDNVPLSLLSKSVLASSGSTVTEIPNEASLTECKGESACLNNGQSSECENGYKKRDFNICG